MFLLFILAKIEISVNIIIGAIVGKQAFYCHIVLVCA